MVKAIFFATLVLFPFGQLFKLGIFNLFDVAVLALAVFTLLRKPVYPQWYRYFLYFVIASLFSLLVNYQLFEFKSLLYLIRLWSYSMVAVYISNYVKNKTAASYWLLAISIASAIFGWTQYFIWPDLTALKYFGWDDHLLRMVGTFLDPTYLGLILVLGSIIALEKKYYKTLFFLAVSVLFTYSRSSYLVLLLVFVFDFIKNRNIKKFVICNLVFVILLLVIPKGVGEGTNLARTVSGNNKLINYTETLEVFKQSPVFGVGFNNICMARQKYLGDIDTESHSCNGADSSVLFLLATTGVIGLTLLISCGLWVVGLNHSTYYMLLTASFFAVFVHSLFANSLFYPHIMFWIFSLVGLQTESNSKSS